MPPFFQSSSKHKPLSSGGTSSHTHQTSSSSRHHAGEFFGSAAGAAPDSPTTTTSGTNKFQSRASFGSSDYNNKKQMLTKKYLNTNNNNSKSHFSKAVASSSGISTRMTSPFAMGSSLHHDAKQNMGQLQTMETTAFSSFFSFLIVLVILLQVTYMGLLLLTFKQSGFQADFLDDRDFLMELSWQKALKIYLVVYLVFYGVYFGIEGITSLLFAVRRRRKDSQQQGIGNTQQQDSKPSSAKSLLSAIRKEWVHRIYLIVSTVSHLMSSLLIIHRIRIRQQDEVTQLTVHHMLKDTFVLFTSSLMFDLLFPLILQKSYWKWRIISTEEDVRNTRLPKRILKNASSALHLYKAQYQSFISVNSSRLVLIARVLIDYLNLMGCYLFLYYTGHREPNSIMRKMAVGLCVFYHTSFGPLFFLYATNSFMRIHEWYSPSESSLLPRRLEDIYKKYVVYLSIVLLSRNFISVCVDVPFLVFKLIHSSYVYIDPISSICMSLTVGIVLVLLIFFWLPFIVGISSIFCCCCDFLNVRCFRRVQWLDMANAALPITAVPSDILPDGSILRED